MPKALASVAAAFDAMEKSSVDEEHIDTMRLLLRRAVWWISHAESGLGNTPLDETDFRRSTRILGDELNLLYEPEPKSWNDLDPLTVES